MYNDQDHIPIHRTSLLVRVPAGMYDVWVYGPDHYTFVDYGVEVSGDMTRNFTINQVGNFTGSVQGVISYVGEFEPDGPAGPSGSNSPT